MSTQSLIPDALKALIDQRPIGPPAAGQNSVPPPPIPMGTPPQSMSPLPDPAIANTGARLLANQNELRRLTSSGSGIHQITNPVDANGNPTGAPVSGLRRFGGALARIGSTAEAIVSPRAAAVTPGTDQNHERLLDQATGQVNNDLGDQEKQANTTLLDAQPELKRMAAENNFMKTQGLLGHYQDQASHWDDQTNAVLAQHGLKTDPQTGKPVPQTYEEMSEPLQAMEDLKHSQKEETDAIAALNKAKNDPSSPAYRAALQAKQTAERNSQAAVLRAQAYYGRYLQGAYNKGLDGQTLPGSPQITDDQGNVTTVGSTNASHAIKSNANVGQFGDVAGATDNIEQTAQALVNSGGRLNSPSVVYALQNTHGTPAQVLQSIDKANLTPEERTYVISNLAYKENLQALRKSAGGTVSDSAVDRLEQLAPSGSTPDLPYLLNQTGQIRQTWARLGKGVATASGGLKIPGENGSKNPPSGSGGSKPAGATGKVKGSDGKMYWTDAKGKNYGVAK